LKSSSIESSVDGPSATPVFQSHSTSDVHNMFHYFKSFDMMNHMTRQNRSDGIIGRGKELTLCKSRRIFEAVKTCRYVVALKLEHCEHHVSVSAQYKNIIMYVSLYIFRGSESSSILSSIKAGLIAWMIPEGTRSAMIPQVCAVRTLDFQS